MSSFAFKMLQQSLTRLCYLLGMPLGFRYSRRIQVAPNLDYNLFRSHLGSKFVHINYNKFMKILAKIISISLLAICSNINAAEQNSLFAHKWSLGILNGAAVILDKFPQQKPYLHLHDNNTFSANMGCNQIHGTFTLTSPDGMVFAPNVITTKMACEQYFMTMENDFIDMLQRVKYWEITDERDLVLHLKNDNKDTIAMFTSVILY
jgi:heat shock protein HslJ